MLGYLDLFPGLYYYRLVTRIISDTLSTNGFGHRFILITWKYCLFSFLHFKTQILVSEENDICVETCRFDTRFDEFYQPWGLFSETHTSDCHLTCPILKTERNGTYGTIQNRDIIPTKLRCPTDGGFIANEEFVSDPALPNYLRYAADKNLDQIVQKNSIFNIYLTFVEIFYFCIIAQMVSELDKYLINNLSHKLESSGWAVYFETVAEILAEILLLFSTVVQAIGIYNTRICIH